jgi:hypothetical protein
MHRVVTLNRPSILNRVIASFGADTRAPVSDMTASSLASQLLQGRRLVYLVVNRPVKDPDAAHRAVE